MIQRLSVPQVHEVVQLGFLAGLTQRISARRYILKGGANLRMFFGSPRSSEDMDFDAIDIPDWQLAEGVEAAVKLQVVDRILRANGLTVVSVNSQKQTLTTQRWTIEVNAAGHRLPISTTGEFSHRASAAGHDERARAGSAAERVSAAIAGRYAAPPIVLPHYLATEAMLQKIAALALRKINQPRDVFDLDLLLARFPAEAPQAADVESNMAERAAERATEFDFGAFRDSVLPFIDDAERPFYEEPAVWSDMQDRVATYLLGLAR
jgi:predicted nucleotidyltransferase component of viral defense system